MKQNKIQLLLGGSQVLLAFLMSGGVRFWFHACISMEETCKPCVDCQHALTAIGGILLIIALLSLLIRRPGASLAFCLSLITGSAAAMWLPKHLISLCMMASMRCNAVMYPAVLFLGCLMILVSGLRAFLAAKEG